MKPSTKETLHDVLGILILSLFMAWAIWLCASAEEYHRPKSPPAIAIPCKECFTPSFDLTNGVCPWCEKKKVHVRRMPHDDSICGEK